MANGVFLKATNAEIRSIVIVKSAKVESLLELKLTPCVCKLNGMISATCDVIMRSLNDWKPLT